jgi:hypothetical protein
MLWYSETAVHRSLQLLLNHDDEREYAYNKGAERALELAAEHGWQLISMKEDWKEVF